LAGEEAREWDALEKFSQMGLREREGGFSVTGTANPWYLKNLLKRIARISRGPGGDKPLRKEGRSSLCEEEYQNRQWSSKKRRKGPKIKVVGSFETGGEIL